MSCGVARPLNADADATRRRILQSALALFGERGPGASPIRAIAGRAEVSLAMVHHYFGNKDGLYEACVDAMYDELASFRDQVMAEVGERPAADLDEIVERVVRAGFRFARAHQPAMRLMLRQVVASGELPAHRRERLQMPFLIQGSELLAGATGRPASALRPALQSALFLLGRYAISTEDELSRITGATPPDAVAAVEDHLVDVTRRMLGFASIEDEERE